MFDWDPKKAQANQLKHGVSFEEAATAFLDKKLLRNQLAGCSKKISEARRAKKSTSGGVLRWYVGARRSRLV
jgi:uncharacterized DUF497 family protein